MNPADLTLNTSPNLVAPAPLTLSLKHGRVPVPRVDLEPIYTQLKAALGQHWGDYKAAVNAFCVGSLNQAELSWVLQPLLSPAQSVITSTNAAVSPLSTLHLHNTLLAAIYANTLRDPPPTEVAPWVVATDKPSAASKNAGASGANDKAEERLKKEVMAIHARDRRRIKTLKDGGRAINDGLTDMQDYRHELAVKPPDITPQSAGGLQRTNWDIEIRRRYQQSLAEETLEFPTLNDIQSRIEPICYEEGLTGGCPQPTLQSCAEMMEQATEVYLKELLGALCAHVRANGSDAVGVQTAKFKRQLRKEEDDAERGVLQRNPAGLLPVEMEAQAKREPLGVEDLRLSAQIEDVYVRSNPFLVQGLLGNRIQETGPKTNGIFGSGKQQMANGGTVFDDAMDEDWSWRGAGAAEKRELWSVLDDCLAIG